MIVSFVMLYCLAAMLYIAIIFAAQLTVVSSYRVMLFNKSSLFGDVCQREREEEALHSHSPPKHPWGKILLSDLNSGGLKPATAQFAFSDSVTTDNKIISQKKTWADFHVL